jgi:hypothetical protein
MGEVIQLEDFRNKKKPAETEKAIMNELDRIVSIAMLGTPEEFATIYESSLGYVAPDRDPA